MKSMTTWSAVESSWLSRTRDVLVLRWDGWASDSRPRELARHGYQHSLSERRRARIQWQANNVKRDWFIGEKQINSQSPTSNLPSLPIWFCLHLPRKSEKWPTWESYCNRYINQRICSLEQYQQPTTYRIQTLRDSVLSLLQVSPRSTCFWLKHRISHNMADHHVFQ